MMKRLRLEKFAAALIAVGVISVAGVPGARRAEAQGAMRIGSASARAKHAEANLNTGNYVLTGGVSVNTPDGQSVEADSMVLTMGRNPITRKQDVARVTAEGRVRFKAIQSVAQKGLPSYVRTISGSANKAIWRRLAGTADLTGDVTVTSDDPSRKIIWRNAATALLDLRAGTVKADAANGEQMVVEMQSK